MASNERNPIASIGKLNLISGTASDKASASWLQRGRGELVEQISSGPRRMHLMRRHMEQLELTSQKSQRSARG